MYMPVSPSYPEAPCSMVKHVCMYDDWANACRRTKDIYGLKRNDPRCVRRLGICMKRRRYNHDELLAFKSNLAPHLLSLQKQGKRSLPPTPAVQQQPRAVYTRKPAPVEEPTPATHCRLFPKTIKTERHCRFVIPRSHYEEGHIDSGCDVNNGECGLMRERPPDRPKVQTKPTVTYGKMRTQKDVMLERALRAPKPSNRRAVARK